MGYIRSAALRGFADEVTVLGGDPATYARAVGLRPDALLADDVLVRDEAAAQLLELAAHDLRRADLGLRIARRQDITTLGSLAVAIQHSPTLGDALDCTSRYLFVHNGSLSVRLGDDPRGARGVAGLHYGPAGEGLVQATDMGLAFAHGVITYLHGGPYGLLGVELPYRPAAEPAAYEAAFGAPVTFEAPGTAAVLRLPQALAAHRLAGVNAALRRLALAHLAAQTPLPGSGGGTSARVRAAVRESLGTGSVEIAAVARLLAVHHRTLQRRLEAEGTTFGALLDEVRRGEAHRLLTGTDLPLAQVSAMVGFAEQSALSRAARRWWGAAPRAVRGGATPDRASWGTLEG